MGEAKKLLSNSFIVFIGTIIASIFSYFFNMLMGRLLGPAQYGEMTAIMSILMITSVGGGAILTVTMHYSAEIYHAGSAEAIKKLLKVFSKHILFIALILLIFGLILAKPIAAFFNISHLLPVVIAFSSFVFGFLILINKGILQGTQKFLPLSVINAAEMILRLLVGIVLVRAGMGLNGAVSAIVFAVLVSYLLTFWPLGRIFSEFKDRKEKTNFKFDRKDIISYSWPTTFTMLLLMVSLNLDIIFVKHYFQSEEAGIYAAISTVGKIILYATAPIVSVMFPMISERKINGSKHYLIFLFSLLATALGAALVLAIYMVAPSKIVTMLYGTDFISMAYLLPQVGVLVLFYTLINLVSNYFLAIKDFTFLWFFLGAIALQVLIIERWHPSIVEIIKILTVTLGLLFGLMMTYYLIRKKEQIIAMFKGIDGEESQAVDRNTSV